MPIPKSSSSAAVPKGGYKAMKAAPAAECYAPSAEIATAALPKKVDLRPFMTPVEDQGQTSSCVANAVAGAFEYGVKRATKQNYDVSRLYVYYNARWRNKDQDKDEGSFIQYAMEGLQKFGACPETTWPFKKELLLEKPNQDSYKSGADGRVKEMRQVPVKLEAWKQSLAEGLPIVFGCILFDSFDQCQKRGGVVPMPSPDEVTRKEHGGHSMCCVGYSDVDEVFIVRNSWGADWADKGYCYMPYNYLMNDKFNDGDCWVFTPPTPLLPPVEAYVNDERPVVNNGRGVDFVINEYPVEAYAHIAINLFATIGLVEWSSTVSRSFHEYSTWVSEERFDLLESYSVEECIEEYSESSETVTSESFESAEESETEETEESEEESEGNEETEEEDAEEGADDAEDEAEEDDEGEGDAGDEEEEEEGDDEEGDEEEDSEEESDDDEEEAEDDGEEEEGGDDEGGDEEEDDEEE